MLRKSVLGFAILAAGLLVWSCGDGSVDSLTDSELLMISRFPSTIDYDMLDSIVEACKKDAACWEKAKKTGEIYKGDYTEVIRDSSGNIVVVEGDSAYVWKDGKKLPVFNFSSNSNDDDDEDVTSSGSTATSGSSSKRSSASGYDVDEYTDGGDGPDSNGSGSGGTSVAHDRSSSSKKSTSSSSVDLSFLNSSSSIKVLSSSTIIRSSSSKKVTSSSSVDLSFLSSSSSSLGVASSSSIKNERSSSSQIVIEQSSVSQSSSSVAPFQLSSSSTGTHSGGGGNDGACKDKVLSGTCVGSPNPVNRGEVVTYRFTPDGDNECDAYNQVEWNVTSPNNADGASVTHLEKSYASAQASYPFEVSYSVIGDKKSVVFSMGGENIPCNAVTVKRPCDANTYTCTGQRTGATNNLWKNAVQYSWTFSYSGCLEVTDPITWNGTGLSVNGYTATKSYAKGTTNPSPANQTVSVTVVDELGSRTVNCTPSINVVYEPDLPPTCAVNNIAAGTGLNVAVTPSSVTGCAYDNSKCSYSLTLKDDDNVIVSSPSGYNGGALTSFVGSSTNGETLTYTLTLKNYLDNGYGSCDFDVTYYDEVPVTATTTFLNYSAGGTYSVTIGNTTQNGFFCKSSINSNQGVVIGTFGGNSMKMNGYNPMSVTAGQTYVFEVLDTAPADLKCGIAYN